MTRIFAIAFICLLLLGCLEEAILPINRTNNNTHSTPEIETTLEIVASGLYVPWSIVFTDEDRMIVTERNGNVRLIQTGILREDPLHIFTEVRSTAEEGLMGAAKDPQYDKNRYLYFCLAYTKNRSIVNTVVRMTDEGTRLSNRHTIMDDIPAAPYHAGCRIAFGPDEKLYITTGDATQKAQAQNLESLHGKILRINPDGSIPSDNPFAGSPVWSYGHRNPQGIDWHPVTGAMYSTEHGPSMFDGPPGGDEINLIRAGGNYGWPAVSHERSHEGMIDPILIFTPAEAPASGMFYGSEAIPQWNNSFFFGALRGEAIWRIVFDTDDPTQVVLSEKLPHITVGRIREITQGPDDSIFFTTSNRDGRGSVRKGDDKVYRLRINPNNSLSQ